MWDASGAARLKSQDLIQIEKWIERLRKEDIYFKERREEARKGLKLSYRVIGFGARRICYDLQNGLALKVAIGQDGIAQCHEEWKFYHSIPPEIQKHFCIAVAHGEGWIIMKKMTKEFPKKKEYANKLSELIDLLHENGILPYDLIDQNLRINESGDIVVIDYSGYKRM